MLGGASTFPKSCLPFSPIEPVVSHCLPTRVPVLDGASAFSTSCLPFLSPIVSPHGCLCWMGSCLACLCWTVCPPSRGLVSPCLRLPVDRGCARVPVCPCARGSGCARVPVSPGQRQVQKSRSPEVTRLQAVAVCLLIPQTVSPHWGVLTVDVKAGAWSGCSIWSAAFLPVNFRMAWLLWHVEVHFHCAGSHQVYVCVLASTVFLLNILVLNINIFLLNINIIIFLSLDTNFNRLRSIPTYLSTYLSIYLFVCLSVCLSIGCRSVMS